jgi:hypothetical protein
MTMPPAVSFKVVTFAVPAAEYDKVLEQVLTSLNRGAGMSKSPADFSANGFVTAAGALGSADRSIAIISQSDSQLLGTNYYTISDENGYDITMTVTAGGISLPYVDKGTKKNVPLKPGRLALRIAVRRFSAQASVFKLTVQPVWMPPYEDSFIEHTLGVSNDILFRATAIETNMQAGELVLVAPAQFKPDTPDMANIFMTSSGNKSQVKITLLMCTGMN